MLRSSRMAEGLVTPAQLEEALRLPFDVIAASARKNTYSMATDAVAKLREGRTTLDELFRVMPPAAIRELRSMVI